MTAPTRIYVVTNRETRYDHLIRASNQAQAIRYAARNQFDVAVATQDQLVDLIADGVKVEDAGADDVVPASQSGLVNTEVQQ